MPVGSTVTELVDTPTEEVEYVDRLETPELVDMPELVDVTELVDVPEMLDVLELVDVAELVLLDVTTVAGVRVNGFEKSIRPFWRMRMPNTGAAGGLPTTQVKEPPVTVAGRPPLPGTGTSVVLVGPLISTSSSGC